VSPRVDRPLDSGCSPSYIDEASAFCPSLCPAVLIRIVRMTFRPEAVDTFLGHFDRAAPQIRGFDGCEHLALWQDAETPTGFTTHSHWTSAEALDDYRHSNLFRSTWAEVKPLFAARPAAHSYIVARPAVRITQQADADG